ncbi:hypothetical protein M3Y99_00678400 [Aphelenchoides fujianensis]|nr:hypothetical protein M3Y99_00678400 [Aphelenchoides fujianensis]
MGAGLALVCCVLLLLFGHLGLYHWNMSNEYLQMVMKNEQSALGWSALLVFCSGLYGLFVLGGIVSTRRGNDWRMMECHEGCARFFRSVAFVWLAAALVSTIVASQWFFAFAAYFLLNAAATGFVLLAFQSGVKKYEEFIDRTLKANAHSGHVLTQADAHAVFELLNHRRHLSPPTVWDVSCREKLDAWHADDFFTIGCWMHELEGFRNVLATKEPKAAASLHLLIARMQSRCEKYALTEEKRAQFRRLVQLGGEGVVSGADGPMEVEVRKEIPSKVVEHKREAASAPFDEPPPKYEEKTDNVV